MTEFGKRLDGPGGRRHENREPVVLTAALMTVGCSRPVILVDLSKTGAHMRIEAPMQFGQQVWIKAAPVEIFGTVAWVGEGECGILFDDPLGDEDLARLRAQGRITAARRLTPEEQLAVEDWKTGLAR